MRLWVQPVSRAHLHHKTFIDLAEPKDLPDDWMSKSPPTMGLESLLDMAADRKLAGVDISLLEDQTNHIEIGDMVKLCFLVLDDKPTCCHLICVR